MKKTDTIIFTHGDSDGVCSGAIAKSAYPDARVYFTSPVSLHNRLDMAEDYDNIIICDIAVDERSCVNLYNKINDIASRADVTYIDHHPLPRMCWDEPWFYHDLNTCAAELTYKVFKSRLERDIRRIAVYGAIGDYKDNTPAIKKWTRDWDKRSLYFQAGTLIQALQYVGRNYDFKREIVDPLSTDLIPSEIPNLIPYAKKASRIEEDLRIRVKELVHPLHSVAYVLDPEGYLSKSAIYAASYGRKGIGIAAEHRNNKAAYDLSLRSRNSSVDINLLLRDIAPQYGGSGGGHPMAAGGRIPEEKLDAFLQEFDRRVNLAETKQGDL